MHVCNSKASGNGEYTAKWLVDIEMGLGNFRCISHYTFTNVMVLSSCCMWPYIFHIISRVKMERKHFLAPSSNWKIYRINNEMMMKAAKRPTFNWSTENRRENICVEKCLCMCMCAQHRMKFWFETWLWNGSIENRNASKFQVDVIALGDLCIQHTQSVSMCGSLHH